MPSHGKKWLTMIRDARAGRPHPAALPRVADVDCRHHCRCRPPVHIVQQRQRGFFPLWPPPRDCCCFHRCRGCSCPPCRCFCCCGCCLPLTPSSHRCRCPLRNRRLPHPPKPEQWTLLALGTCIHGDGAHLHCHTHAAPIVVVVAFVFIFVVVFAIIVPPLRS